MSRSALADSLRYLRGKMAAQQRGEESDEQLLHAFTANRDQDAFGILVRRHGAMVLHVCRRVLGHEQDAEDAFQAVFLVLARKAASLRKKTALAAFLHGTAYRVALAAQRAAARRRKHEGQISSRSSVDPADDLSWREVRALLDEEIARLPEIYRSVFVLCHLENHSRAEAAQRLGLKERAVVSRLAAARKRLGQRLARRGVELSAVLAATTLATHTVSALPPVLLAKTMETATRGVVSASVAELVKGAAAVMVSKAKVMAMVLLTAGVLTGTGAWALRTTAPPQSQEQQSEPSARPTQAPKTAAAQKKKSVEMSIKGKVVDPEGKPVRGAKLFAPRTKVAEPQVPTDIEVEQIGVTDAQGRFHVTLSSPPLLKDYLIAHAAGFGIDWIELKEKEPSIETTLRLVKDVPITGRVVNTEGAPLAGVSVSATGIQVPAQEKLDDYLAGWLRNWHDNMSTPQKRLYLPLDGISGTVKTDKDGRFLLQGIGGERIVSIFFHGGGIADATPWVVTREEFDPKPYNAALRKTEDDKRFLQLNPFLGLYAPSITWVAQPGKIMEGVVKDADTKKTLSGIPLHVRTTWEDGVSAVSDAEGKYRIEGLSKNAQGYSVHALPPRGSAYLIRNLQAADTDGFTKVRLDIDLVKGALVTGRVVDKQTGKGVRCGIRFAPLTENKFFGSKPGFDNYRHDRTMQETDGDGRFRLATIPGKALILAQVYGGEKFHGQHLNPYRRAVPEPDHKELFQAADDSWTVATAGGTEFLSIENAVRVIDVQEKGETRVELFVDHGVTARIAVEDGDGKPLAGAWAAGMTDHWPITYQLSEATATVYALNPEKPRTMAFYHPEKKLGGTAIVRGDEKDPVIVKLAPLGEVSGRLWDSDGKPLEGVEVSIHPPDTVGSELYRFAAPSGKPVVTDKDGRFRIKGVVPDLKFWLNLRQERTFFVGEPRIGTRQVKTGEALDLGEVRIKPR